MDAITRGTTPTIRWDFKTVNVGLITSAIFTLRKKKDRVLEKSLESADVDTESNSVSWTLSQEETLALKDFQEYSLHCDWLLPDTTRGAGVSKMVMILPPGKDEVI